MYPAATETFFRYGEKQEPSESKLTSREQAILARVARGLSSKAISNELNISARTVESHRQNIKTKLQLNTTAELTRYAYDQQLL
jgi:two-component system nitrate/nitrite response regulator NarL